MNKIKDFLWECIYWTMIPLSLVGILIIEIYDATYNWLTNKNYDNKDV